MHQLTKSFKFEAAHWLPHVPYTHKCSTLHGHSYQVSIAIAGTMDDKTGMLVDFAHIEKLVLPLVKQLDHRCLNMFSELHNPTAEVLAQWFWNKLKGELPLLTCVTINETCTSSATYSVPE